MPKIEFARLTTEVTETTTVMESARVLIEGLAQKLRDNAGDPVAIRALADALDSKSNELAAAVVANTPVEPSPA